MDRIAQEYDKLLKCALKHKCFGRRFKRKLHRLFRMNAWNIKHKTGEQKK